MRDLAANRAEIEVLSGSSKLAWVEIPPPERHPALVYLASLAPGSRRTMRAALETVARLVSGGRATARDLAWHHLRYQHTALVRTAVAETYALATANKILSALRGVLKECFRLGYTPAEDYHRACDLKSVRGSDLPRGRALSHGELRRLFEVCALDAVEGKKATIGARDALLENYACTAPEALNTLAPEERQQVYRILRLRAAVTMDGTIDVSEVFGEEDLFFPTATPSSKL